MTLRLVAGVVSLAIGCGNAVVAQTSTDASTDTASTDTTSTDTTSTDGTSTDAAVEVMGCGERPVTSCDGGVFYRCIANEWVNTAECGDGSVCVPVLGCRNIVCSPGTRRCAEERIEVCGADGTAWIAETTCADGYRCDATTWTCEKMA